MATLRTKSALSEISESGWGLAARRKCGDKGHRKSLKVVPFRRKDRDWTSRVYLILSHVFTFTVPFFSSYPDFTSFLMTLDVYCGGSN